MSQTEKLFERPKVRFSQPSEDSSTNSENPDKPFQSTSDKPRIRSVVTLKDPFKIIYKNGDLPSTSKSNVNNTDTQHTSNAQTSSDTNCQKPASSNQHNADLKNSTSSPNTQKTSPCINISQNHPQKHKLEADTVACPSTVPNGTQKSKPLSSASNSKGFQKNPSTPEPSAPTITSKNTEQVKTGAIPKSGRNSVSKLGSKHVVPKTVPLILKKTAKKTTSVSNENVALPKSPACRNTVTKISRQKEKTPAKGAVSCSNRNVTMAKTVPCGLKVPKPGSKTWKTRSKSSPVKKTVLRDVTGHPTNVYVGPGIARYYSQPFKIGREKETPHIRPDIVSGEKLSRPEYNSIMCTIDELKKVQAEKFVTDVEHLPLVYRNLVNEKVSAALDFPPDEAIYKNLVDLSVNENQLPSRVTRSKDPEPRHRDIVPKLSDFFTPTYSEEYCTAVQIRPNSPEIFSNWSAFAISDKIFGWKHDMDQGC